jgi:hypothetical protein
LKCIVERRPPRLIAEIGGIEQKTSDYTASGVFRQKCRDGLKALAKRHKVQIGQFLLCGPKPIKFEAHGSLFSRSEAEKLEPEEWVELIMIFRRGQAEPQSIVDVSGSIISGLSNQSFSIQRLYLAEESPGSESRVKAIQDEVREWTKPTK